MTKLDAAIDLEIEKAANRRPPPANPRVARAQPRSYRPMLRARGDAKFAGNALRFATEAEAAAYLKDLSMRWTAVAKTRVDPSDDPVNYVWRNGYAQSKETL